MPVQGTPTSPLVGGNGVRDVLEGYVFQSGIHDPEHSSLLTYKYPQYYLTSLLDRIGAEESVEQTVWSWNVMDRTRQGGSVTSVDSGGTGATVKITTDIVWSATNEGYYVVGDLIRFESGEIGRVTATGDSGASAGFQELDLVRQESGNWSAALITASDNFGHIGNVFGEASSAPTGRLYLPVEEYNRTHITRRSFEISGTEFTNRTYLDDGKSWYFEQEDIEMKEFAKDRELITLFGVLQDSGTKSTRGVWDYAKTYGVVNGYSAAAGVTEDDIMDHISDLLQQNVSNEIFVLCGATFLKNFQKALRDYAVAGGISYGGLGDNTAGLDFHRYKFMGKTVNIAYYEVFDDSSVLPTPNRVLTSAVTDFSDCSLWLDFGTENNGRSLITMKYKSHNGVSRKFVHGYVNGMVSADGTVGGNMANADDKFSVHMLAELGVECRLPNRLGVLAANAA